MDGNDGNWSISTSGEPGISHKTSQRVQGPTEGTTSPMPLNRTARLAGEGGDGYCSPPRLGTGAPRRRGEEALPPRGEREAGGRSTSPKTERRDRSTAGSRTDKPAIFLVSAHRGSPPQLMTSASGPSPKRAAASFVFIGVPPFSPSPRKPWRSNVGSVSALIVRRLLKMEADASSSGGTAALVAEAQFAQVFRCGGRFVGRQRVGVSLVSGSFQPGP